MIRKGKTSRNDTGAQNRALPFPARIFRASRKHAHDVKPAAPPAPAPERDDGRQLALALDVDGYDPRQRHLFGWAR